jgi:hypothetical protein
MIATPSTGQLAGDESSHRTDSPATVARRLIEMSEQLTGQLDLYAADVRMLHDERATTSEWLARARHDLARSLHEQDKLRGRLEKEIQRAELLRTENRALVLAGIEARARWTDRGVCVRPRWLVAGGTTITLALALGAALLSS